MFHSTAMSAPLALPVPKGNTRTGGASGARTIHTTCDKLRRMPLGRAAQD